MKISSEWSLQRARESQRPRPATLETDGAETPAGAAATTTSTSTPTIEGGVAAASQAARLERGARSLSGTPRTSGAPALPGADDPDATNKLYAQEPGQPRAADDDVHNTDGSGNDDDVDGVRNRRRSPRSPSVKTTPEATPATTTSTTNASREGHLRRLRAVSEAMATPPALRSAAQNELIRQVGLPRAMRMIGAAAAGRAGLD